MVLESGSQSQVESYQRLKKWHLTPPCLNLKLKFDHTTKNGVNGPGERVTIPGRVTPKTQKMVLNASLLKPQYGSRVKWSNPENGVAPSLTLRCSNNWKGSLRVTLDCGRQLYLLTKYHLNKPEPARENETRKILWDLEIQTDHLTSARRPDSKKKKARELAI